MHRYFMIFLLHINPSPNNKYINLHAGDGDSRQILYNYIKIFLIKPRKTDRLHIYDYKKNN